MRLIIVSGRSGSGKSTALNVLEDAGFNCIDNLPAILLSQIVEESLTSFNGEYGGLAICIDARNRSLALFAKIFEELDRDKIECELIFFDAADETLLKRFSETQRPHPLKTSTGDLRESIKLESEFLVEISEGADLRVDTSSLTEKDLRKLVVDRIVRAERKKMNLAIYSFGYKHGLPMDVDYIFDMRCLPNPYWLKNLRPLTGLDEPVINYLSSQKIVNEMIEDISFYLSKWITFFEEQNRLYLTIAIGCTGGQHRSVYVAEQVAQQLSTNHIRASIRHREL